MKALSAVLPAVGMLLAFTTYAPASALKGKKPKNVFFSGMETSGEVTDPGWTEMEDGNLLIRGMVQRAQDTTNDERTNGELTIEANACLDPATSWGPLWGTFVLENPGGKWLAAWIGQKKSQGVTIFAMGYGVGTYEDLMANWTYTRQGEDPNAPFSIHGFIVQKN